MTFNHKLILRTVSTIMLFEGIVMIPAALLALYDKDTASLFGLSVSAVVLALLGTFGILNSLKCEFKIKIRESYFIVLICWLTVIIGGILPYVLSGKGYSFSECVFESVAGWTTSSAWVIDIDDMSRSLILWKAVTRWFGGMGVILLASMVLSALGVSGQKLAGAEVTGPELTKSTAKMLDTIKLTYFIYACFSIIELLLLIIGGIPFFDALINMMSTISTSGILDYQGALAANFTPFLKGVLIVFSIIGSLNFVIYTGIVRGRFKKSLMDYEMHLFLGIISVSALFIAVILTISGKSGFFRSLIDGFTGVVSYASTAGFPLEHVNSWPSICKALLLMLMIIGGSANSTSGGIKIIRFAVFVKLIVRGMYKRIHPRAVKPIMLRNHIISSVNASSISTFILLFFSIYLFSTALLSLENFDMETTLSAPIALLTNTGSGFGLVTNGDFGMYSVPGKLFCSLLMMIGRLEMYPILILFSRSYWNSDKAR